MKLKDYVAQHEPPLYFSADDKNRGSAHRIYEAEPRAQVKVDGAVQHIGAINWETGDKEWLDPELEVTPMVRPPRPYPPCESWMDCRDTTLREMRGVFRKYSRQIEAYLDVVLRQRSKGSKL